MYGVASITFGSKARAAIGSRERSISKPAYAHAKLKLPLEVIAMYRGIGGALRVVRGPLTAETDGELSLNVGDLVRISQDPLCHEGAERWVYGRLDGAPGRDRAGWLPLGHTTPLPVAAEEEDLPPWPHWGEVKDLCIADCYVCYDVRVRATIERVGRWIRDVRWAKGSHVAIALLGINGDRGGPRRVSADEGRVAASQYGAGFFCETNAPCEGPQCSYRDPAMAGDMPYIEWDSVVCQRCRSQLAGTDYDYQGDFVCEIGTSVGTVHGPPFSHGVPAVGFERCTETDQMTPREAWDFHRRREEELWDQDSNATGRPSDWDPLRAGRAASEDSARSAAAGEAVQVRRNPVG